VVQYISGESHVKQPNFNMQLEGTRNWAISKDGDVNIVIDSDAGSGHTAYWLCCLQCCTRH